ncbi:MAG: hypothetical protein ACOY3K_08695 [Candidatus Omnitrophota bacterium]
MCLRKTLSQVFSFPNDRRAMTRSLGILFLLSLAWGIFLVQGFPVGDLDDWDKVILSKELPWSTFASSWVTPWSKSENWTGQAGRMDEVQYKRILNPVMLKGIQQVSGFHPFAFYFICKCLFFALTVALVFWVLAQGLPIGVAWIGALAYLFIPVHYSHVLWLSVSETYTYFLVLAGFYVFNSIVRNLNERGSFREYMGLLAGLFVIGWISIKAKELSLILPVGIVFYSFFKWKAWKGLWPRVAVLFAFMALIAFQVVPVTNLDRPAEPRRGFGFETLGRLLFRNYQCGYDDERLPAFFSWDHVFPVSLARNIGFFLLWAILFALLFLGIRRWVLKKRSALPFFQDTLVQISLTWFLVYLPFLGMFQPDPRYLSGLMPPLILLLARLLYSAGLNMNRKGLWVYGFCVMIGVGFFFYENVQHVISLRLQIGQKFSRFMGASRAIFEDVFPGRSPTDFEVGGFYCRICSLERVQPTIDDYLYYFDYDYAPWNRVAYGMDNVPSFKEFARQGYRYYVTHTERDHAHDPEISLVARLEGINSGSLFEKIIYSLKDKKPAPLYVYKYIGLPIPDGKPS